MNREDVLACYALVCTSYRLAFRDDELDAWHVLLGDLDGRVALESTRRLCGQSRYPPVPAEVRAEADRLAGPTPPALDVATGYYVAGRWEAHPLVDLVARAVYWDRHTPEGNREFRDRYRAALHEADEHGRDEFRRSLRGLGGLAGPPPMHELDPPED